MPLQRIDKIFSNLGLLTRAECAKAIRAGRIALDGQILTSPAEKTDPETSVLALDGERVNYTKYTYIMLNKPEGYISSTDDPRGPTVLELLPEHLRRRSLFPTGRLDRDSVGLLILTNNGELAHRLLSPKRHVQKVYQVRLQTPADPSYIAAFAQGITIDGPEQCKPAQLEILPDNQARVTLTEGKYHQVKRMFAALGNKVEYLERIRFGGLELDPALPRGHWRELSSEEITILSGN